MNTFIKIALVCSLLLSVFSSPAQAQTACGDRLKGISQLENRYSEMPHSTGLSSTGSVIELFVSKEGTFTIIMTRTDGISCMVASGEAWEKLKPKKVGKKL